MPATTLAVPSYYSGAAVASWLALDTVAAFDTTGIPSSTELSASTTLVLDDAIFGAPEGWSIAPSFNDVPIFGQRTMGKVRARASFGEATIRFLLDVSGTGTDDVRSKTLLALDETQFIVKAPAGLGTGKFADVFKTSVASVDTDLTDGDSAVIYVVGFQIQAVRQNIVLP